PFILEIRDIWPESILAVGAMKKSVVIRVLEWLELRMYASASHIVTVGDGYRQKLLEKGVPDSCISVVMNGVDREFYTPRPPDDMLRDRWGIKDKFVCGYVGTIGMACGLDTVLDAAQSLKARGEDDVVFLLVGDGAIKDELESKAKSLDLKNVIFTGRQPKGQMPDYLSLMDVSLVCLRKSNLFKTVMPSKIFEAAAMRKPIINSVAGFASDFIQKAHAGISIEPENPAQLVDAVLLLKNNPDMRAQYGASGMECVFSNYDRKELAAKYLSIIERIANP
ncbi:MAG: glycosyltransferase family 4 protein, partial [Candidatus Hydrogenedentes bacterium]|nr:glycosyltransferase family 4 protein [Candidatus Hydrogenedentota bacterium]